MKSINTLDGFKTYKIYLEQKYHTLGNRLHYKKDIDDLLSTLDDLRFDSLIFIFGFDSGEYFSYLQEIICPNNKIIIIEPNKEIYDLYHEEFNSSYTKMFFYEENQIKNLLKICVSSENFTNLYVHPFGNYKNIYKEEYESFIKNLDRLYFNAHSSLACSSKFKDVFLENLIANLNQIENSSSLNSYENSNVDVPAIIVSAGPSLDKNIKDMIKHKNKLDKCFIIAGSRTLKVLLENDITPDLVVSIDPVNANYDMMKNYLDCGCPLAFYEFSNRYIVRDYSGNKVYISGLLSKAIDDLKNLRSTYAGGSVAHTCIDIAHIIGCNPIVLVGQDLAHTYDKVHADSTTFLYDESTNKKSNYVTTKDIYGNDITTTFTLEMFKVRLEEYIEMCNNVDSTKFINCSYGADIKGCKHLELSDFFEKNKFNNKKNSLVSNKDVSFDFIELKDSITNHVDEYINISTKCINLCEDLLSIEEDIDLTTLKDDDYRLNNFMYILKTVSDFEDNIYSKLLGGHYSLFLFEIKKESFSMLSKDFDKNTSSLRYQSNAFLNYFTKLKDMLEHIQIILNKTLTEFY